MRGECLRRGTSRLQRDIDVNYRGRYRRGVSCNRPGLGARVINYWKIARKR